MPTRRQAKIRSRVRDFSILLYPGLRKLYCAAFPGIKFAFFVVLAALLEVVQRYAKRSIVPRQEAQKETKSVNTMGR